MNKKKDKKITNLELLESINRSFSKVEKKIDTVDIKVEGLKNQLEGVNNRIDDFVTTRVEYEDHDKLKARVSLIEKNLK